MSWNWQGPNWPNFIYPADEFRAYERDFLHKAG